MPKLEFNIDSVLHTLQRTPDLPVIFKQHEQAISPGYHITEVKMSVVNSLDCGQGTDQWRELVVQLLDGNADSSNTYMSAKKMTGILKKALHTEPEDGNTKLYFEFTPGNAPLQKSSVNAIDIVNNTIAISLTPSKALCKPYQRALASGVASSDSSGCCGAEPVKSQTCCDRDSTKPTSSCCS